MNIAITDLIHHWQSLNVLVVGDVMLDSYLRGDAERLCPEAPVPVVAVTERQDFPGGAANVAANLSSLAARVTLLSVVGRDGARDRLQLLLKQRGITSQYLLSGLERTTLSKQRVVANSHLIVRLDQGSTGAISVALEDRLIDQVVEQFPKVDAVIISDYGYGVLTPRVIQTLVSLQQQYSRTVVIDSKQLKLYQAMGATAVKPNYKEVIKLLELPKQTHHRADQIAMYGKELLQLTGANIVAVTLDVEGTVLFEHNRDPIHIPVTPAPISQTAGAGDTFISALTLALTVKASTRIAASLASAATAVVVSQPGTSTCSVQELKQQLIAHTNPTITENLGGVDSGYELGVV